MKKILFYKRYFNKLIFLLHKSLDIWMSDSSIPPSQRRGAIGYTSLIGGVCSSKKYSIVEYAGFNEIQNAAHELAHRYNLKN